MVRVQLLAVLACSLWGCCGPGKVRYQTRATYTPTSGAYRSVTFDASGWRPRAWDIGNSGTVELKVTNLSANTSALHVTVDEGVHTLGRDVPAAGWSTGDPVDPALIESFLTLAGAKPASSLADEARQIHRLVDDAVAGPKGQMPRATGHLTRVSYSSAYR